MKKQKLKRIIVTILVFVTICMGIDSTAFDSKAATKAPAKITLNVKSTTLTVGKTYQLKVKAVNPSKASKTVTWSSSNKKIAIVSNKGKVTAKKAGTVKITAASKSNKKVKAVCKIKVYSKVKKVTLNKTEAAIKTGQTVSLKTVIQPSTAMSSVAWKTSDKSVAAVSSKGVVTGKKAGKVTIIAVSKSNKKKTAKCVVTVSDSKVTVTPTVKPEVTISPTAKPTPTHIQRPTPTPVSTVMPEWNEGITREEWVSALVEKMNMRMLEENMIKDEDTQQPMYTYDDIEQCMEPLHIEAAYQNQILPEEEGVAGELLFHPGEKVTREFAVVTVMRALGFYDESVTLECSDKDKVTYTVEAAMAVEYGLINLIDNTFKPKEFITAEESTILFQFIEEILNTRVIDENHVDVLRFTDNVKNDYDNVTEYSVLDVTEDDEAVIGIALTQEIEPINVGDIIVLQPNTSYENGIIMEVHDTYVDSQNNLLKITGSDPENIFDVYEKIDIEGYADPVLDEIELADGVELEDDVTEEVTNQSSGEVEVTEQSINSSEQIGDVFSTLTFTYKKTVKVTCRMRGVVYDFDLDQAGINQLYYSMTNAIDVAVEGKLFDGGSESTVDLATIPFKIAPVGITLKLKVKLVPTIKGTVSVVCTVEGTEGVQYYNGQFIPIKEMSTSADLRCNVDLGIGVRLDLGIYFLDEIHDIVKWFKKEDKESKPFYNIGAEAGVKVSVFTKEVYKSEVTCSDVTAYVYAELYAGTGSLLEEICTKGVFKNLNATIKWVIWDSKYSVWRKTFHSEVTADGAIKIVEKCTQKSCTYAAEVYGENEETVGDVEVVIKKVNDGIVFMERNVITDSDGKLIIDNLSPGTYEITYKKEGYDNYVTEADFIVSEDNSISEKIFLGQVYGGTYKDVTWSINSEGHLLVTGTGDMYADTPGWQRYSSIIKTAKIDVTGAANCAGLFYGCGNLCEVDISDFDMSQVTNMRSMFCYCSSLTHIEFNGSDMGQVTDMTYMFKDCSSLTYVVFDDTDTKSVTNMYHMFSGCKKLESADLSGLDTEKVTDMQYMFESCEKLISLDLKNFNTSSVTNMCGMFSKCTGLTNVVLTSFDTGNVKDMHNMFCECRNLLNLDMSNFDTSNVTDMSSMFYVCANLEYLNLSDFDTNNVTNMRTMFNACGALKSIDVSNFDTRNVTSMNGMFGGCESLKNINVENFNTSRVADMSAMFCACKELENINVNNFDTSNVTNMSGMFMSCYKMASIDVSNFDTSKVTTMDSMFEDCREITNLNLSNYNTISLINMSELFRGCLKLVYVDLSSFDISNVKYMSNVYGSCPNLDKEKSIVPFEW